METRKHTTVFKASVPEPGAALRTDLSQEPPVEARSETGMEEEGRSCFVRGGHPACPRAGFRPGVLS